MRVLLAVAVVLLLCLLAVTAERAVRAVRRGRRRRLANERFVAVAARVEEKERRRSAAAEASGALTSLLPTIHDHDPRNVDLPVMRVVVLSDHRLTAAVSRPT
jgi:hypothetical protein